MSKILEYGQVHNLGEGFERLKVSSDYIDRERRWLNDAGKDAQRVRVAQFLDSYHSPDEKMRLLSLPCLHWSFETMLLRDYPSRAYRFYGIEWVYGIMELGRPFMPGDRTVADTIDLLIGSITRFRTRDFAGQRYEEPGQCVCHWLHAHVGHFLSIQRTDKGKYKKRYAKVYKRMSAVWLDFTSQLCADIRRALLHVGSHVMAGKPVVPVVVSFMAARDNHSGDSGRVNEVCRLLGSSKWRTFDLKDSWQYVHHGIPMLNVAGLLTDRGIS